MFKNKKDKRVFIGCIIVLEILLLFSGCASEPQSTNTPKHVTYHYLFPAHATKYHPGDKITLTWKAVPAQEQTNQANTIILKATIAQNSNSSGDLNKPITVNTTNWSGKTYTMTFQVPKNAVKQRYQLVTSINIKTNTPTQTTSETKDYIMIE